MQVDFSRPVLAIDTSTSVLSLALRADGKVWSFHEEVGSRQSSLILPQIQSLLTQAQLNVSDLAAIVYAQGPGAFTGLRIGLGVAQGLATPFSIPLIAVPSLDAIAYQVQAECVLAASDARMGEVFYAWFNTQTHQRLSCDEVGKVSEITLPVGVPSANVQGVGNAFALQDKPAFDGVADMPCAEDYLNLAESGRYAVLSVEQAELLYVRNKVALTAKEQAERKG